MPVVLSRLLLKQGRRSCYAPAHRMRGEVAIVVTTMTRDIKSA